jgi:hypothetical protein
MSCDVAMSAAILLAAFHPAPARAEAPRLIYVADVGPGAAVNPLAREPLYADIVRRAEALRSRVQAYRDTVGKGAALPALEGFKTDVDALSALDMQGHVDLAKRGTDGDLKCILKGISQDLPRKLAEVEQAATPQTRGVALEEMFYLLRDNIEVITTPPTAQSGKEGA